MNRLLSLFPPGLVITDGAWGTEFQRLGLNLGLASDLWNLSHPEAVTAVARSYVEAGSRVILTNTFQANPISLTACGEADRVVEINRRGVELSRKAATEGVRVFGSIGPTGRAAEAEVLDAFRIQADALAGAGADALLFETFSDIEEARLAARAARPTGLPIVASFSFGINDGAHRTMTGASPERVAQAMAEAGVDAVGANCGDGPFAFIEVCRRLKRATGLPIWIKPNAGLPTFVGGKAVYAMTPEEFASHRPSLVDAGASFLGGCCGTSPAFIRAIDAEQGGHPAPSHH